MKETTMWNLFCWLTGRIGIHESLRRARYFEARSVDGNAPIFMRWPNGCVWRRVPSHDIDPAAKCVWAWEPADRLPSPRKKISKEEAYRR